jgi:hypothetical protein
MGHKVGDLVWRGYARVYSDADTYWPEIRPGRISKIADDGSLEVWMFGLMPGTEGKRNPGSWRAWNQDPELYHATPEAALEDAKAALAQVEEAETA